MVVGTQFCLGDFLHLYEIMYNVYIQRYFNGVVQIKNQDILSSIREISETLSLTNEPKPMIEAAVDTLIDTLSLDCCWVQLIGSGGNRLSLAACRGFNPDMKRELDLMDINHCFCNEIVGMGNNIIIPDLGKDGRYDISIFEKVGFSSLIAVPIMTYRIHGILGFAYRIRRKFNKDFSDFLTVIAGLIGMALNKSKLHKLTVPTVYKPATGNSLPVESGINESDVKNIIITDTKDTVNTGQSEPAETVVENESFHEHIHRMENFSKSHKTA